MNNVTQLFNTYFECQKQFDCIGEKIFNNILKDYPYIFNCNELEYSRTKVIENHFYLCYYDYSVNMLHPYFEFSIPLDIINNNDSSILEKWLQKKNEDEKSAIEFMAKIQNETEYQEYLKLKNKFENK